MKHPITVTVNGQSRLAQAGQRLSEILSLDTPCGGHGICGKCKVIATGTLSALDKEEYAHLSQEERACGVRLACRARAMGNCEITLLSSSEPMQIVTHSATSPLSLDPSFSSFGVALDVGTTTLAARLYDTTGTLLSETARTNPQTQWGADVINRIEAALNGHARTLTDAIRATINEMLETLACSVGISPYQIDGVVITGNTVMLSLLDGEDVEPFSHAPFAIARHFGETLTAQTLTLSVLSPSTPVYLPPCISAFVGADTVCALLATGVWEQERAMLADVGTNGEMALCHQGRLLVCSTAAGPAFEGVGISMGMRSAVGAIDRVDVVNGALYAHVIGEVPPLGICGSGLVDAVACMLDLEILDNSGYLEDEPFPLSGRVTLTAEDIRMLQLAKSAICAGLLTLLSHASTTPSAFYLAGGFGNYLNRANAAKIGLLPRSLANIATPVGNAALQGATLLLLDRKTRTQAQMVIEKATVIDLAQSAVFSDHFMMGMMLDETCEDLS